MRMKWLTITVVSASLCACASATNRPSVEEIASLAPTGKLRVGLYTGNPLQLLGYPKSQEMKGVGFELGKELAQRMGVAFEPVVYPSVGAVIGATQKNEWDIAVLVVSSGRLKEVDFTPPLVEIELGYLVLPGSGFATAAEVDQPGIRIAVPAKGQADVILSRSLKHATVVRAPGLAAVAELLRSGKADVAAANKPILFEMSEKLESARVLEGRFSAERAAFAIPKGRNAGAAYAARFVEQAKSEGLVQAAIDRAQARGALVAPPTKNLKARTE